MSDWYILDENHVPVPVDLMSGAARFNDMEARRVDRTTIGNSDVSTVFLGLDHAYSGGPPVLFETLVFGGELKDEMDRYHTWDEALAGHAAMCERVRIAEEAARAMEATT